MQSSTNMIAASTVPVGSSQPAQLVDSAIKGVRGGMEMVKTAVSRPSEPTVGMSEIMEYCIQGELSVVMTSGFA